MLARLRLPIILLFIIVSLFLLTSNATAAPTIIDDFNDASLDSSKWSVYGYGGAEASNYFEVSGSYGIGTSGGLLQKAGYTPGNYDLEVDFTPSTLAGAGYAMNLKVLDDDGFYEGVYWEAGTIKIIADYTGAGYSESAFSKTMTATNTYHIKLVRNATGLTLYVDGVLIGSKVAPNPTSLTSTSSALFYWTYGNGATTARFDNIYYDKDGSPYATDNMEFMGTNATIFKTQGTYAPGVRRNIPTNASSTVQFNTQDGTAHSGVDYAFTSGTLTFTGGSDLENMLPITIYNTDPTVTKYFNVVLSNPGNGNLGANTTINITIAATGAYSLSVAPDPCPIMGTASATLTVNDPTYQYNNIQWFLDGDLTAQYVLSGASQWQEWNGTGYVNCANASVFTQSEIMNEAGTHVFRAVSYNNGVLKGNVNASFTVTTASSGQTLVRFLVIDGVYGTELDTYNAWITEVENMSNTVYWTNDGYILTANMYHNYLGEVNASGYINTSISFYADVQADTIAEAETILIRMYDTATPANPNNVYVDVRVNDPNGAPVVGAVVKFANSSGYKTKDTNGVGVARMEVLKGDPITWTVSSSSYQSKTGTQTWNAYAILPVNLGWLPTVTATPVPPGWTPTPSGGFTGGTYTPYNTVQRQNQAMQMIDQLLEAGPSLMQLAILAVFMGLVMMIFDTGNNKRRRYR